MAGNSPNKANLSGKINAISRWDALPHADAAPVSSWRIRPRHRRTTALSRTPEDRCAAAARPRGLSGPELQGRLSELGSTLPIIFLTGHPDIPTTVRTIKARADDFLTKPVTSNDLLRAIGQAFARHEVERCLKSKLDVTRAHIAALTPRERSKQHPYSITRRRAQATRGEIRHQPPLPS
jgi:DNA-binding NtrC family response regulator